MSHYKINEDDVYMNGFWFPREYLLNSRKLDSPTLEDDLKKEKERQRHIEIGKRMEEYAIWKAKHPDYPYCHKSCKESYVPDDDVCCFE